MSELEAHDRIEEGTADALSVSAAMALAKGALEGVVVKIVGEVSEVSARSGYKAVYFTVKDEQASLPCMMWNNRYRAAGIDLAVGQLVEIAGRFSLYAAKGRMNFDVFSVAIAGEGDLRMKVANLAKKLEAEGLTASARKRAIPEFPERIGLVTSPNGAAVHDVLRTLRRRFPAATVFFAGVPVEGATAAQGVIEGMRSVYRKRPQVILVVRGGGSFEDLMPFNDEALARAIAACDIPVVTGIGHEVDTTIADMVSDFRASTPTAAAEAVSPSQEALQALFASRAAALRAGAGLAVERAHMRLDRAAARPVFSDPRLLFAAEAQALDMATDALARALPMQVERLGLSVEALRGRLARVGATANDRFAYQLGQKASRLSDLSPVSTLARGYSVTRGDRGIVRHVAEAPAGSDVRVAVSDGVLDCIVKDAREISPLDALREE